MQQIKQNYWTDSWFRSLSHRGRLAFMYADSFARQGIIVEDMCRGTGLEYSEALDWLKVFINQDRLDPKAVIGGEL